MAEFQPPEVEQAYLKATHGLVPEPGLWDHIPEPGELDVLEQKAEGLRAELRAEGINRLTQEAMLSGPEERQHKAIWLHSLETQIKKGEAEVKEDGDLRKVIGFVLQGLTREHSTTFPQLMVRYIREWQLERDDEPTTKIACIDAVPDIVAIHPATKERNIRFAALAGHVVTLMLTPEVVDAILSDNNREEPILLDSFIRSTASTEKPVEVIDV